MDALSSLTISIFDQRGVMMIFRTLLAAVLSVLAVSQVAYADNCMGSSATAPKPVPEAISLGSVLFNMLSPVDADLPWSMGATPDSGINWASNGIAADGCGLDLLRCRRGQARISIDGKELHNLHHTVEPVIWDILIYSRKPKDPQPEGVDLTPNCDASSCQVKLDEVNVELKASHFLVSKQYCSYTSKMGEATLFSISKDGRDGALLYQTSITQDDNPKKRSSLTLLLVQEPSDSKDYCKKTVEGNA
jgi:hypothetical protein